MSQRQRQAREATESGLTQMGARSTLQVRFSRRIAMHKATTFLTALAMALLAAPMAWAASSEDSDREAAKVVTKQAAAAYNLGHYDEAAALYEEAYKLVPDPILLYDLGQAYRQANKLDKALTAYRSYLRTAPEDAPNRERVKEWVSELEWTSDLQAKTAAMKAAQKQAPSSPAVPKAPESQVPREQVPPPSTSARPDLVLQTPKAEEPHPSASWKKWAPWVGVGITAALGVATIVEGLSARSSFSDLQGACGKTKTCTDSQVDGVKSKATVTNVLLGLTAASAAATGVAFYFNYSGGKETGLFLAWKY